MFVVMFSKLHGQRHSGDLVISQDSGESCCNSPLLKVLGGVRPYSLAVINLERGARQTWVEVPILSFTGCVALGKLLYSLSLCTQPLEVGNKRALQVCTRELLNLLEGLRERIPIKPWQAVCAQWRAMTLFYYYWIKGSISCQLAPGALAHWFIPEQSSSHWVKLPVDPRGENTAEGSGENSEGRRRWRQERKFCLSINVLLTLNLPTEGRKLSISLWTLNCELKL